MFLLEDGPAPEEMILGSLCEAFNCTPDVALALDARLAFNILDARLARMARDSHNRDVTQMSEAEAGIWLEITRALGRTGDGADRGTEGTAPAEG